MIDLPVLEELRETRRRLSEACQGEWERYGQVLREAAVACPGHYVTRPLTPASGPLLQRLQVPEQAAPQPAA